MSPSCGVIYIATGPRYIQRAIASAVSVKRAMPDIPITLFSNGSYSGSPFDGVVTIEAPTYSYTDKVKNMALSPYDYTLFLDADTYVNADVSELFLLLERFDLAVAHDTFRLYTEDYPLVKEQILKTPPCFPMLNSGVILFKRNAAIAPFFEVWQSLHEKNLLLAKNGGGDQVAFREALFNSNVRFTVLPPEYNCRFVTPVCVDETVKILHGPYHDYARLQREMNKVTTPRVFLPSLGTLGEPSSPLTMLGTAWYWAQVRASWFKRIRRWLSRVHPRLKSRQE